VSELLTRSREETRARTIAAGGTLFGSARLNTRLRESLGDALAIARVPEPAGLALGAALAPAFLDGHAARLEHVTLGPTFSESEIKDTLDNCRLDYVYEPDWQRLLTRVSALLARGRVVAWLQGAVDFGPRSAGSRSILCDPSNRYARDNINQYLLRRALDHPLPVAMTRDTAAECLEQTLIAPFTLQFATVRESCADKLKGVLDGARGCPIHGVDRTHAAELCDLLDLHRQRTQVPGLIHITLASEGEPLAGTPRAAIRAMFSSAIDVLVMGRFLLMKDYWLLRSES
jgi:carbamoyltransferase